MTSPCNPADVLRSVLPSPEGTQPHFSWFTHRKEAEPAWTLSDVGKTCEQKASWFFKSNH